MYRTYFVCDMHLHHWTQQSEKSYILKFYIIGIEGKEVCQLHL